MTGFKERLAIFVNTLNFLYHGMQKVPFQYLTLRVEIVYSAGEAVHAYNHSLQGMLQENNWVWDQYTVLNKRMYQINTYSYTYKIVEMLITILF